jgi:predicted dehydrogenase
MKRYALVGTGHRSEMYVRSMIEDHADVASLVAMTDSNPGRIDYYERLVASLGGATPRRFEPADLESIISAHQIDRVIVTSPDFTHAEYIDRALRAGADVIVEKPLTIDAVGCRRIAEAVDATGRQVIVTFNYRYSPRNSALKQVVQSGQIGRVTSVAFEWVLDTAHGADYFRRWHREKANSGGLLVHKASHHFDLVNWWIDGTPERVFASGGLRFYGAHNATERGLGPRPARGTRDGAHDPFELDLRDDPRLKALYLENESLDGYVRDRDVFSDGITIEDNLALVVDYAEGSTLSYSLNAHSPWEGYRVAINGTEGRAELEVVERGAVTVGADGTIVLDPTATDSGAESSTVRHRGERLVVQRHWQTAHEVTIPEGEGSHGGGDAILLSDVFRGAPEIDPLGRPSGYLEGVRSVAVGIAGNESLATGRPVTIAELALGISLEVAR